MRVCPFCKKMPHFGMPELLQLSDGKWSFYHHCSDKLGILITADTKEEVLCIWEGDEGVKEHPAEP